MLTALKLLGLLSFQLRLLLRLIVPGVPVVDDSDLDMAVDIVANIRSINFCCINLYKNSDRSSLVH